MPTSLTPASYIVLGLIDKLGPSTPYDVKRAAADTISRFWSLPHAQVYAQCDRLVEAGMLDQHQEDTGRRRRVLSLTPAGREALSEWVHHSPVQEIELRDFGLLRLFFGASVAEVGPPELAYHRERLAEVEKRLERLPEGAEGGGHWAAAQFARALEQAYVDTWERVLETA